MKDKNVNINTVYNTLIEHYTWFDTATEKIILEEILDKVPPVDAVLVRHGRWIDIDTEMYTWKIRCSKCEHERSMMSTGQIYPMYCENCGALMDGKENNNE